MHSKTWSLISAAAAAILFIASSGAFSQSSQANLNGTITDASGNGIPSASVQVVRKETMWTRSTTAGASGVYSLPDLPIGTYEISVSGSGFNEAHFHAIELQIGQTRTLNVTLQVSGPSERVDITAATSRVDQNSAVIGTRYMQSQIDNLPVNGRNWSNLLPLTPGATDSGTSDQRTVRFAGHGRDDNNITFDGVDATGISNQPQKTGIRLAIPLSGVSEFKVDSTLYIESADGTGGQMVLASPSGTSQFHGEVFEYLRNDVFDARNPFASSKQPFRLNQFGGNLGGPIKQSKTFFFVNFEAYRQSLDQAIQGFTPSAAYRQQVLAQSPELAPLINAYPAGTIAQPASPSIDKFSGLSPQRVDETSGMFRIDHRISGKLNAFIRLNVDKEVSDVPLNNLEDRQVVNNRPINGVFSLSQALSPTMLNETKFGFNQVFSRTNNMTVVPYTLQVSGFTNLSSAQRKQEDDTSLSVIDNFSIALNRHIIKLGAEVRRVQMNPGSSATGTLAYTDPVTFAANQLNTASVTAALPMKRLRKVQTFEYIMDEFKVSRTFTTTMSLRYQFFNVFHETEGRAVPFDLETCGGFCQPGAQFSTPRTNDFDPRVALAWAPASRGGRTVMRAGFGIYHGDGQLEDQNLPAFNDQARYSLSSSQIPNLSYPIDSFLMNTPGTLAPRAQNRNRKDESSAQWSLSIQQDLPSGIVANISYAGNKGTHLQTITSTNLLDPVTGVRPYPQFGQLEYRTNDSNSTFHSMILSAQRRLKSGFSIEANYMWSHAINDGSLGGGEADIIAPQNPYCRACERASSAQDIRHFFNANGVYELPFGSGKPMLSDPGWKRGVFGGWTLNGLATARSGLPVNVTLSRSAASTPYGYNTNQRPNLVPGVSLTPPGGSTTTQWINPAAFSVPLPGTFGNAGRNIVRGPGMNQLDLGLAKRAALGERAALQFRWEVFNVLNRAQNGQPSGNFTVPAQLGVIQSTINTTPVGTGTPRQMQFVVRLMF
jgi:hypothetical protein